tara:strand:- start:323 stop:502 length:180 start_codon:yes stop_codon:yes gene_type:complete
MNESKGLGDSIEKFTKATGIKSLTEIAMDSANRVFNTKKDCGCRKRKQWLNDRFPYKNR